MSLALTYSSLALRLGNTTTFGASGGTAPYTFSVVAGGAGGTINGAGLYTAPSTLAEYVGIDTIKVVDAALAEATVKVVVGTPLELLCDIIRREMGLSQQRVWVYNQKVMEPKDEQEFVVVELLGAKPFGVVNRHAATGDGLTSHQSVNMMVTVQIDIKSWGMGALYRKEELLLALTSDYAERQQELNAFKIGRLPVSFVNLSAEDGAAIPYRFNLTVNLQYAYTKSQDVAYFDSYDGPEIVTDPE